ncbi:unnamed protein product [Amoebophrya sp. A25]|nr:unnamed protein product [Amoebophrya sp. A25]|eukprot:GSA25T00003071001.1
MVQVLTDDKILLEDKLMHFMVSSSSTSSTSFSSPGNFCSTMGQQETVADLGLHRGTRSSSSTFEESELDVAALWRDGLLFTEELQADLESERRRGLASRQEYLAYQKKMEAGRQELEALAKKQEKETKRLGTVLTQEQELRAGAEFEKEDMERELWALKVHNEQFKRNQLDLEGEKLKETVLRKEAKIQELQAELTLIKRSGELEVETRKCSEVEEAENKRCQEEVEEKYKKLLDDRDFQLAVAERKCTEIEKQRREAETKCAEAEEKCARADSRRFEAEGSSRSTRNEVEGRLEELARECAKEKAERGTLEQQLLAETKRREETKRALQETERALHSARESRKTAESERDLAEAAASTAKRQLHEERHRIAEQHKMEKQKIEVVPTKNDNSSNKLEGHGKGPQRNTMLDSGFGGPSSSSYFVASTTGFTGQDILEEHSPENPNAITPAVLEGATTCGAATATTASSSFNTTTTASSSTATRNNSTSSSFFTSNKKKNSSSSKSPSDQTSLSTLGAEGTTPFRKAELLEARGSRKRPCSTDTVEKTADDDIKDCATFLMSDNLILKKTGDHNFLDDPGQHVHGEHDGHDDDAPPSPIGIEEKAVKRRKILISPESPDPVGEANASCGLSGAERKIGPSIPLEEDQKDKSSSTSTSTFVAAGDLAGTGKNTLSVVVAGGGESTSTVVAGAPGGGGNASTVVVAGAAGGGESTSTVVVASAAGGGESTSTVVVAGVCTRMCGTTEMTGGAGNTSTFLGRTASAASAATGTKGKNAAIGIPKTIPRAKSSLTRAVTTSRSKSIARGDHGSSTSKKVAPEKDASEPTTNKASASSSSANVVVYEQSTTNQGRKASSSSTSSTNKYHQDQLSSSIQQVVESPPHEPQHLHQQESKKEVAQRPAKTRYWYKLKLPPGWDVTRDSIWKKLKFIPPKDGSTSCTTSAITSGVEFLRRLLEWDAEAAENWVKSTIEIGSGDWQRAKQEHEAEVLKKRGGKLAQAPPAAEVVPAQVGAFRMPTYVHPAPKDPQHLITTSSSHQQASGAFSGAAAQQLHQSSPYFPSARPPPQYHGAPGGGPSFGYEPNRGRAAAGVCSLLGTSTLGYGPPSSDRVMRAAGTSRLGPPVTSSNIFANRGTASGPSVARGGRGRSVARG